MGEDTFKLYDTRGRPGSARREHVLPLTGDLVEAFASFPRPGEYALSASKGKKPISSTTLAGWARDAVGTKISVFQLKRIRSGVETALASEGVSREIRGHLQSHGLTGVQAKHYDAHDYLPQKLQALEVLARLLVE